MALVPRKRYTDPFTELEKLQEEMNTLFDFSLGRYSDKETSLLESTWAPAVDIYDRKDAYVVKADLPGIAKEDIDVTMQHNMLTIRGEKKHEKNQKRKILCAANAFTAHSSAHCHCPLILTPAK